MERFRATLNLPCLDVCFLTMLKGVVWSSALFFTYFISLIIVFSKISSDSKMAPLAHSPWHNICLRIFADFQMYLIKKICEYGEMNKREKEKI